MDIAELDRLIAKLPRKRIGFYPTPFHRLDNLSATHGVNFFLKREDMAGPGTISGSKTRLAEFILGQALVDGVTHVISQGVYLTNSGMQFAVACRVAGLTPILYLTRDHDRHGELTEYRGNLLLNKIMDVEVHHLTSHGSAYWDAPEEQQQMLDAMNARKAELEALGHKVIIVPSGGAHPYGFVAHALTFKEMLEQAEESGVRLDYVYHTAGTGTALPGLVAAKLMTGSAVRFRSIAICAYRTGDWINEDVIVDRVKHILRTLGFPVPADHVIRAEIDVDQRFIGEDYAVPSPEGVAAIKELATSDGVFLGPVYTGKGFAGLLEHVRTGKVEPGSNVAFLHTGDTGNLFEIPEVVGAVTSMS
nr:pyridoxal-phosphate dependent enzyme [Kibdelosporangium sp. MJ126-NF4]CEL20133.1 pyridoxal phosphate-dependent deaminase, putative [Kibdelosporangium sp. MJ126-NF4]CTQ97358.1 pyridoxal phosphate-dependent deaminase, putative [Kibdelosporangium sp. MJ126-NF4]